MKRLLFGVALLIAACVAALAALIPIFTGRSYLTVAAACLLLGFLSLTVTSTPATPLRPLRITLTVGALVLVLMLVATLSEFKERDRADVALIAMTMVGSVSASLLSRRRPRIAAWLLLLLAIIGAVMLYRLHQSFSAYGPALGPSATLAFLVAAAVGTALIAALWHGRRLFSGNLLSPAQPDS